jgi:hypothetical protein
LCHWLGLSPEIISGNLVTARVDLHFPGEVLPLLLEGCLLMTVNMFRTGCDAELVKCIADL